jgi:hypothetical protein
VILAPGCQYIVYAVVTLEECEQRVGFYHYPVSLVKMLAVQDFMLGYTILRSDVHVHGDRGICINKVNSLSHIRSTALPSVVQCRVSTHWHGPRSNLTRISMYQHFYSDHLQFVPGSLRDQTLATSHSRESESGVNPLPTAMGVAVIQFSYVDDEPRHHRAYGYIANRVQDEHHSTVY